MQKRMFAGRTLCHSLCRASLSQCGATCLCLCACLRVSSCGLSPRAVPQLSLNKLRAPLGNRGLVLGLNVSYFFRSLGTSNGARAERTRLSGYRQHTSHKIAGSADPYWTPVSVPAVSVSFVLAVAVDAT